MADFEILAPVPTAEGEAAAVICGHDFIRDMGVDKMTEFHGFVQEVLDTAVMVEMRLLRRQLEQAQYSIAAALEQARLRY